MAHKTDLPAKEAQLFRQLVKHYEGKQYKKGIRAADQVLKKFPKHGETLSMKGLILFNQGKKPEGFELVREGLKLDLKSQVCWHVYGLLWRADNNYDEAMKCYKNALRMEKDNLQILRDLSGLQIQLREFPGFIETRRTILHLKSSNRVNWMTLAVGHHLNSDYDLAIQIMNAFREIQKEVPEGEEFEHSEMLLYEAFILEEAGKSEDALQFLEKVKDDLKDPLGVQETKARLYLSLGQNKNAEKAYRELLDINSENHRYYAGLFSALNLPFKTSIDNERTKEKLVAVYEELEEQHPRSTAPRRLPLEFLEGETFHRKLTAYVQKPLLKGIPSLFSDLKDLYRSPEKAEIIGEVFGQLLQDLQKGAVFPDAQNSPGEASLWIKLFLANHYDRLNQTEKALELVERCIGEDPQELECYCIKRRILKHAGDLEGAIEASYIAQDLDAADRYLNCVAAKSIFRADHIHEGDEMATIFTKASEQPDLLYEMQCMWYEIEAGSAHFRLKNYGKALKDFLSVVSHFAAFREDQYDFHTYCTRKMTLRSYISMLRMEDDILKESRYAKAAELAIQVYIELADAPAKQKQQEADEEVHLASLSLEDRKKHKLKKKKDAQKKAKEEQKRAEEREAAREAAAKHNKGKSDKQKNKDDDPDGAQLAAVEDPLAEASKLLQVLRENHDGNLKTHLLSCEVALRRHKILLALHAVSRAIAIAGRNDAQVHDLIVRLAQQCRPDETAVLANGKSKDNCDVDLHAIVSKQLDKLLEGKTTTEVHKEFVQQHGKDSVHHSYIAAKQSIALKVQSKEDALQSFLKNTETISHRDLGKCQQIHQLLTLELSNQSIADQFFQICKDRFQHSSYFEGSKASPKFEKGSFTSRRQSQD